MTPKVKVIFGILATIAFCTLIILISISDMVINGQVGMDIGAYTLYSGTLISLAKENKKKGKK